MEGTQRAMRVAFARENARLEQHLSLSLLLAPPALMWGYLVQFGDIMTSFRSLGSVQQATISMVAPGISKL